MPGVVLHVAQGDGDGLQVGDAGQVDNVFVRIRSDVAAADAAGTACDTRAGYAREEIRKGKDDGVVAVHAAAAALDATAIRREIDIKGAGYTVGFPGDHTR